MGLPAHIQALLDPVAYPDSPASVELRQTHISYVFITPTHAYKVKKPVDFGFLDFTTLEKREFYCNEEVRLNRRLAPDVYLGVEKITVSDGVYRIGGGGKAVDYAVKMLRVPDSTLLSELIKKDAPLAHDVERVAAAIAAFHENALTNGYISGFGDLSVISKNAQENFSQTRSSIGKTVSQALFDSILDYTEDFLREHEDLFRKRASDGRVKDCHGDMHAEHISIDGSVRIIDCIEFNERFRFSDTVADMAFVSMDLDYLNRADLAREFDNAYFLNSRDKEGVSLLNFYKCYRACVRGKVEGFKLAEPEVNEDEKLAALIAARRHFHLAGLYAKGGFKPMVIVVRGLSGTGKTTLAQELARYTGAVSLSSDQIRKELAGMAPQEHSFDDFGKGIYSPAMTEKTYRELMQRMSRLLENGRSCILDATFARKSRLDDARREAARMMVDPELFHVIECRAGDLSVKKRLSRRLAEAPVPGRAVSDMRWEIYKEQKKEFEEVKKLRAIVDMSQPLAVIMDELSWKIFD